MRFLLLILFSSAVLAAPDEELLGKAEGYPACRGSDQKCLVGRYSRMDELFPSRKVAKGQAVRPLKVAPEPFDVDAFLAANRNTGLMLVQGDTVLAERYQYDRKPEQRFGSASMAKTVLGMLVGIALSEQKIRSIDQKAEEFVAELRGHPYGGTSLRHLLTMSSGVRFDDKDTPRLLRLSVQQQSEGGAATVLPFDKRERQAGKQFHYSNADSQVLGLVLRAAVGKPLAEYLSEKIWQPMGAEADASWLVDKGGYEVAYCCLNATLRDYARLGMLLATYGSYDGKEIIPRYWVRAATRPEARHLRVGQATRFNGYGYQTWLIHEREPRFAAFGAYGQAVFVAPNEKIVLVHTAIHESVRDTRARGAQFKLWDNVLAKLSP